MRKMCVMFLFLAICFGPLSSNADYGIKLRKDIPILEFPLGGTLKERGTPVTKFGETIEEDSGVKYKSVGLELMTIDGEAVRAAHAGEVRVIASGDPEQVACIILVEDQEGRFSTQYSGVRVAAGVYTKKKVKQGELIARSAVLDGEIFRFSVRWGPFRRIASARCLPDGRGTVYPKFPERFIDPSKLNYRIKKSDS